MERTEIHPLLLDLFWKVGTFAPSFRETKRPHFPSQKPGQAYGFPWQPTPKGDSSPKRSCSGSGKNNANNPLLVFQQKHQGVREMDIPKPPPTTSPNKKRHAAPHRACPAHLFAKSGPVPGPGFSNSHERVTHHPPLAPLPPREFEQPPASACCCAAAASCAACSSLAARAKASCCACGSGGSMRRMIPTLKPRGEDKQDSFQQMGADAESTFCTHTA